jgi:RNA-binding protein NOB1
VLVVDTGALIHGIPLDRYGCELWTVEEVLAEVRDAKTRQHLRQLPVDLRTQQPAPADFAAVKAFARQSGDLGFLSATDLKLLALCRGFHRQLGLPPLRASPLPVAFIARPPASAAPGASTTGAGAKTDEATGAPETVPRPPSSEAEDAPQDEGAGDGPADEEEEEDAEEGWITEANLEATQAQSRAAQAGADPLAPPEEWRLGCATTDFALQNVLLQQGGGVAVVGPEGVRIRRLQISALRCFSCLQLERDTTKLFCARCGNNTLRRVGLLVAADGAVTAFPARRPPTLRGTIYPLPLPKGGRKEVKIVTAADQLPRGEKTPGSGRGRGSGGNRFVVAGQRPTANAAKRATGRRR